MTAMKMSVLGVVTPCGPVGRHQLLGGTYFLHFYGTRFELFALKTLFCN